MNFYIEYKSQYDLLLEDERNIYFFCSALKNLFRQDFDNYKLLLDCTMGFIDQNNLKMAKAYINNYYAWYYFILCDYVKAIDLALSSYNNLEKYNEMKGMAYVSNSLMAFYSQIGQMELANEWGLKGITMAEELHDNTLLITLLINVSIVYIELDNFQRAKEIYKYIEMKNIDLSDEQRVACCINIAEIEINMGNPVKALEYIFEINKAKEEFNFEWLVCEAKKVEAMVYAKLHDYTRAEKLFNESYNSSTKKSQSYEMCLILYKWANMLLENENLAEAVNKLNEMITIGEKYCYYNVLRKGYYKLYKIYKQIKDLGNSLESLEKYSIVDKKIYNFQSSQWMAKFNVNHAEKEAQLYKILYDKTELLSSIGKEIISNLEETDILRIISREIHKLMVVDVFCIAIYDQKNEEYVHKFIDNKTNEVRFAEKHKLKDNVTLTRYCIEHETDILINSLPNEYQKYGLTEIVLFCDNNIKYNSVIYCPMIVKGRITGALTVQSRYENAYTKNDLSTLKILCNYVAIAYENANTYKKVESMAMYDNLTGIYSRSEILKIGDEYLKDSIKNNNKYSIAMVDLDKLKKLNDTIGHVAADKVICKMIHTICDNLRITDCIGRYGGDEFLIIFKNTSLSDAYLVAENVRDIISKICHQVEGQEPKNVTVSIGLYEFEKDVTALLDGIHKADKALYKAKSTSGNKVICYNA